MAKAPIIISLGGSLIYPKTGIDTGFLSAFREIILRRVAAGERFILICGGGSVCRAYQGAAREIDATLTPTDLDWLGIHVTRLNAQFVRTLFKGYAHPEIGFDPATVRGFTEPVLVAAGWEPGSSTDFDAVLQAEAHGVKYLYNLSNTDYVYDKDPNVFADAKPYKDMDWKSLRALVGDAWDPGLHVPFDPIASKKASELGLEVRIVNGKKLDNLEAALQGEEFIGTVIRAAA